MGANIKSTLLLLSIIIMPVLVFAAAGEFMCATLKKDDGSTVVQQYLSDNCSANKPFSVSATKDGAPIICCIGKQQ